MRTLVGVLCGLALAACSRATGSLPPQADLASSGSVRPHRAGAEKILYSFKGFPDGANPEAGLIALKGALYGTTTAGGDSVNCGTAGCGTVFRVNTSSAERLIYSFGSGADGDYPQASLTAVGGAIYGTTFAGGGTGNCGGGGCGTVFEVSATDNESVLYGFEGGDGAYPVAGLTALKGELYGTAESGGSGNCENGEIPGCGIVFEVNASGTLHVLYSFRGGTDGAYPAANLFTVFPLLNLYGTTEHGGSGACAGGELPGCGTVFEFSPSGKERTLYSFKGGKDGAFPASSLLGVSGMFYGTTTMGGGPGCGGSGCGTIFSVDPLHRWKEKVVYRFKGGKDGAFPYAGLTYVSGMLYGTTENGGSVCTGNGVECGTVFKVTTSGKERVVHRFGKPPDGASPYAGLILTSGLLYGTTKSGGASGAGTVFEVTP